jgi:hypothetical protein
MNYIGKINQIRVQILALVVIDSFWSRQVKLIMSSLGTSLSFRYHKYRSLAIQRRRQNTCLPVA